VAKTRDFFINFTILSPDSDSTQKTGLETVLIWFLDFQKNFEIYSRKKFWKFQKIEICDFDQFIGSKIQK